MSVTIAPDVEARIQRMVESGRYPDADAVLRDALGRIEREDARDQRLRELVHEGIESADYRDLTPELWDELQREAEEEERLGLPLVREAVS